MAALEEKKFEEAIQCFKWQQLLPKDCRNTSANLFCCRAHSYYGLKDMEPCIADCLTSLDQKSDDANAYLRFGMAYFAQEKFDDAMSCYEKVGLIDIFELEGMLLPLAASPSESIAETSKNKVISSPPKFVALWQQYNVSWLLKQATVQPIYMDAIY